MTHELKIWPEFFKPVQSMKKPFEVRLNDREFKVGDCLHLREYNHETKLYTGRQLTRHVSYLLEGGQFGIEIGYCVIGLKTPL